MNGYISNLKELIAKHFSGHHLASGSRDFRSKRLISSMMAVILFVATGPLPAAMALPTMPAPPEPPASMLPKLDTKPVRARKGPHKLSKVQSTLRFSQHPTDLEIRSARIFSEPLVPMSGKVVAGENEALVATLLAFKKKNDQEDLTDLTKFIEKFPQSKWRPALELNLGLIRFYTGHLEDAMAFWQSSWNLAKSEKAAAQAAIANRSVARLVLTNARLGRMSELEKLFAEIGKRPFFGSDEPMVYQAREGFWMMKNKPECAFKCGPFALDAIQNRGKRTPLRSKLMEDAASTTRGTSLAQVKDWADQLGMNYQIAKRSKGAEIVVPSVMHWSIGHFAAITSRVKDHYILKDTTFDTDATLGLKAATIDQETDGYFLIPAGALPAGWQAVSKEEAQNVWGKGVASGPNNRSHGKPDLPCCGCGFGCGTGGGMARANGWLMNASSNITDTPLSYANPFNSIDFSLTFNQNETDQPTSFTFTNFGLNWRFNFLSYLTVDPVTSVAIVRQGDGGSLVFTPSGSTYNVDVRTQSTLVNAGGGVYQLQMRDGSVLVYDTPDGSGNIFMSQLVDPQGNSTLIQFDANFRITTITDAISQVSSISYVTNTVGNPGFYNIASITDPFGRSCSFAYDATDTYLVSITDVIGLVSKFNYDTSSSFITAMNTPYGTTNFYAYTPGSVGAYPAIGLRITFPDGTSMVAENWPGEGKHTYFWNAEATSLYPQDPSNQVYTHCQTYQWTFNATTGLEEPVPQNVTHPLESASPIFYQYPGALGFPDNYPSLNTPALINRTLTATNNGDPNVVDATIGGSITPGDIVTINVFDNNIAMQIINHTVITGDTTASIAQAQAASMNANTALRSDGFSATAANSVITMTSNTGAASYTQQTSPVGATETIALRSHMKQIQPATFGGTVGSGHNLTLKIATSAGLHNVNYTTVGGDTPTSIATAFAGLINADTTLQSHAITAVSNGPKLTLNSYDNFWGVPEISFTTTGAETLTLAQPISATFQTQQASYNTLGYPTQTIDTVGRTFSYSYASNNIDLQNIKETQDTDNFQIGAWTYNTQHRPLTYTDGSGQVTHYTYNTSGQLLTIQDANSNTTTMSYTPFCNATMGGTITTSDVVTITVFDAGLSGGQESDSYTVQAGDSLSKIAAGLAAAVNADSSLQAIGVSAVSSGPILTMFSTSVNSTTYSGSSSGTETVTLGNIMTNFLTQIDGPMPGSKDITTFTYDGYNRLAAQIDSEGYTLAYSYDNANRPTQTLYPDGTSEQTAYDRLDAVFRKDRIGRWTQDAFDNLDRIAFEIDPLGRKTQYTWCDCGSLAALTDSNGNTTSWHHDLQGRTIQKVYQDQTTVNYTYEPFLGRLRTKTDALNQTTTYVYNNDNTAYKTGYLNAVNATAPVVYSWDPNYRRVSSVLKDDWGTISYTYNPYYVSGAAITGGGILQLVHNNVIPNSDTTYTYDALGRTTNRSINGSANSINWTYDQMSRVTGESNTLGSFAYHYVDDQTGASKGTLRLSSINYPNSQVTNFSWYPNVGDQRLQQISNLNPSGAVLSQFNYGYDSAGEITQWQQQQNGNNLCYALGYDLAGQLTSARAGSGSYQSPPANEYYYSYDPGANRTSVQTTSLQTLRVGGTKTTGDVLTLTVNDSGLSGGSRSVSYTVLSTDTLASIALGLATAVNSDTNLQNLGVIANAHGTNTFVNIRSVSPNITTYSTSTNVGATETLNFGIFKNGIENASVGGTKTTGDTLTITVHDSALSGGQESVSHTVASTDSLASIATALKNAVNADSHLSTLGVTATSAGAVISINSTSTNATTYTSSLSSGATETITLSLNTNVNVIATLGGTVTSGDKVAVGVYDAGISGGGTSASYTATGSDTLTTFATHLASAISSNSFLSGIGVSATSSGSQITIQSNSPNTTTYREAYTPSTATESLSFTTSTSGWRVAAIGGSKTTGDVLTIKVYDSALSGGTQSVSYTVLSTDTLSTIASGLASAINANSNLSTIGVTASASGTVVSIESVSPNLTTYAQSVNSAATETIALAKSIGVTQAGYNAVNELVSLAPGGNTLFSGTTSKPVKNPTSTTLNTQALSIKAKSPSTSTFSTSATSTAGETWTFANAPAQYSSGTAISATLSGTVRAGDVLNLNFYEVRLPGGSYTLSYTVQPSDSISSIIINMQNAINAALQSAYKISVFTYNSTTLFIGDQSSSSTGPNSLGLTSSNVGVATETLTSSTTSEQNLNITVGGTATTNDVVSLTVDNPNLANGQETVSYTVHSGDSLSNIASGLASAVNADTHLQAIGVGASSSAAVVSVTTDTSYTQSVSGSATETITLGTNSRGNITATIGGSPTTGDVLSITAHNQSLAGGQETASYTVLSTDTLLTIANGLAAAINADSHLQTLGVSVPAVTATQAFSQAFSGNALLPSGSSTASVTAVDGSSNTKTNNYQMSATGTPSTSLTYDANGNMTSDGTNTYQWDCENRLIKINYPGTGNYSQFAYDGTWQNVRIVEYSGGSLSSTKQFVWWNGNRSETRDVSGILLNQYFLYGQTISASNYYYAKDRLGSIVELTNGSGAVQAAYTYDPFGMVNKIGGTLASDLQYTGLYFHATSALSLAVLRNYSASLARWLNRDPDGNPMFQIDVANLGNQFTDATNLYNYVSNNPLLFTDPLGLCDCDPPPSYPSHGPNSPCDNYGNSMFAGDSERCFCKCMGDSDWANKFRGCLACRREHGDSDPNKRHWRCLKSVGLSGDPRDLARLAACGLLCKRGSPEALPIMPGPLRPLPPGAPPGGG